MTPRERRLLEKKRKAAGKKTLVDHASNFVRSTNKAVYDTLIKSKPTKGRAVRGKARKAPKAPVLPKSDAMLTAEKKRAALLKKIEAERAASKKRLAAIRAGKNPPFPTAATTAKPAEKKPAAKKPTPAKPKPAQARKPGQVKASTVKFNRGQSVSPDRGRTFAEPPAAKAKAPQQPKPTTSKNKQTPNAPTASRASTASTYKAHGSDLHVGRYRTLKEHRAAVTAAKRKKQQNG